MKKVSLKKLSVLGLVLMAASAVTAAILPTNTNKLQANSADNGTLRSQSGVGNDNNVPVVSCVADNAGDNVFSCHLTAGSSTGAASEAIGARTLGNTSDSDGNRLNGDTTSVVS
jgi:hypothetical protein